MGRTSYVPFTGNWRSNLLREVRGHVLAVGAGSSLNLDHYPARIDWGDRVQRRLDRTGEAPIELPHPIGFGLLSQAQYQGQRAR